MIGPATLKDTFQHVKVGDIVCSSGQLGRQWFMDGFDLIIDLAPTSYLTSFYSGQVDGRKLQTIFNLIDDHHLVVTPTKVFSLPEVAQAHADLKSHHSLGKVVVVV